MQSHVTHEDFTVPVDGTLIRGTLVRPVGEPTAVVVIHPATATPQGFYAGFADAIAARGAVAVTYDFRGTGRSGGPRRFRHLRMRDWMSHDVPAVARWAAQRFPDVPHRALGHSIGGHAMALGKGVASVDRFVLVSSHLGVTQEIEPLGERLRVAFILRVVGPVLSRTLGYMPGRRLGLGEDIPVAAMIEWGQWSQLPHYFYDDDTMDAAASAATVDADVLAVGVSDDAWASPHQMDALTARMTGARVARRTVTPEQVGLSRLGHHGLLSRRAGDAAWGPILDWLLGAEAHPEG